MLCPYPGRYLPEGKRIFNYRLARARRIIENGFGIMATKFRVFRRPIIASPEKVTCITKAACSLHNYLKISEARNTTSNRPYCPPGYIDHEDRDGNLIPGDWRQEAVDGIRDIQRVGSNTHSRSAAELRDNLMNSLPFLKEQCHGNLTTSEVDVSLLSVHRGIIIIIST